MLTWGILALSFVGGVAVIVRGDLKTSKRRHIVGPTAKLIGIMMIALPFIVVGSTILVAYLSRAYGSDAESARTHGAISGMLLISSSALALALNLKRWSVPIHATEPHADLANVSTRSNAPDFAFLDSDDDA